MPLLSKLRIGFDIGLLLLFLVAAYVAMDFVPRARYFPLTVTVSASVLAVVNLMVDWARWRRGRSLVAAEALPTATTVDAHGNEDDEVTQAGLKVAGYYLLWLLAYALSVWLVGLVVGTVLYLLAFFLIDARTHWLFALVSAGLTVLGLWLLAELLDLRWPEGLFVLWPW